MTTFAQLTPLVNAGDSDEVLVSNAGEEKRITAVNLVTKKILNSLTDKVPLNNGEWVTGQQFTAYNQYMIFNGEAYSPRQKTTLPYVVGATPDLGFVYQIKLNSLQALSGLTDPSDLDQTHRTAATLSRLADGDYGVDSKLSFSELGGAHFTVVTGGSPNGTSIRDAGNGNTAVLETGDRIYAEHFGDLKVADATATLQAAYDYFLVKFLAKEVTELVLPNYPVNFTQLKIQNILEYLGTQRYQTFVGGDLNHISTVLMGFTSKGVDTANVIKFKGTRFSSVTNHAPLVDGDALRRVSFSGCCFAQIDTCLYSASYAQTFYFDSACVIRQGSGWFIDILYGYDIKFIGNIVEHREHFWRTRSTTGDPACNSFICNDNLIEGLTGKAIEWGACYACEIDGNYMEANAGGYIDCSVSTSLHKGLSITNNSIQLTAPQISNGDRPIKWGKTAVPLKSGGNASTGNLHDLTGTTEFVDMFGDYAAGELYNGYKLETDPTRSPVGYARYARGSVVYEAFNDRYIGTDPFIRGRRIGGVGYEDTVDGVLAPIYEVFGTANPELSPATYGNRKWAKGSMVTLPAPVEAGTSPNKYILTGFKCVVSGSGGAAGTDRWVQMRSLTGN